MNWWRGAVEVGPVSINVTSSFVGPFAPSGLRLGLCPCRGSGSTPPRRSTGTPGAVPARLLRAGHGRSAIRFEGDDLFQSTPQHGDLVPAEKPRPLLLDVREDPGGCALSGPALVGESNDLRAAVGFVGDPLEVAVIF